MGPGQESWLVVGLSNPGEQYAKTRHNVGAMVLDTCVEQAGANFTSAKFGTRQADVRFGPLRAVKATLATLGCYMNVSGGPTKQLLQFYKYAPSQLLVVHDDLDLPLGVIKIKIGGGEGGHNGLRSISGALGTKDYVRLRVGVGRPPGRMNAADYVLRPFSKAEGPELALVLARAAEAIETIATAGIAAAQNAVHQANP